MVLTLRDSETTTRPPWVLPERYSQMNPQEQSAALRSAIVAYLETRGPAAKSVITREIRAPRPDTLQKALDFLATTQQIYVDAFSGSRDPTYSPNGRLAHPMAQRIVDCGLNQYVIRAYEDRLRGKYITITQYTVLPSGERKPQGGIRLDWVDIAKLIQDLSGTLEVLTQSLDLVMSNETPAASYRRR